MILKVCDCACFFSEYFRQSRHLTLSESESGMIKKAFTWTLFCACLLLPAVVQAFGIVSGSVSFKPPDRSILPAGYVRILLTRTPAKIPELPDLNKLNTQERMETIRNLHMNFFLSVRQNMSDPEFLVQSGLSTPEGAFQFSDVPAGKFYLVVTFPAMVRDYKLAWQVPVKVHANETCQVVLNNENLLLPTYSR